MKTLKLVLVLLFFTPSFLTFAQKDICKNVYVWDFTDEKSQKNNHTVQITQEVENALVETNCTVLQRRNYAKLASQVENENAIRSLEGVSNYVNQELRAIQAETVVFGQVQMDFSGNILLKVTFESLITKEILKSEFVTLTGEEAHNLAKRQQKIKAFIAHCVGPKLISDAETTDWLKAQHLNTSASYEGYLKKYKRGKYKTQAKEILADEKAWEKIEKDKYEPRKIERLIKYCLNPQKRHYAEARTQLEDLLWGAERYLDYKKHFPAGKYADEVDERYAEYITKKALQDPGRYGDEYLSMFPNGEHAQHIRAARDQIIKAAAAEKEKKAYAKAIDSPWLYAEDYVQAYPDGKYLTKVEDAVWGKVMASSAKEFIAKNYLELFPSGKYAKEAKRLMQ